MKHSSMKAFAVAALLVSSTLFSAPSQAAGSESSVINVTGYAQQEVAPDTAYVTIGMESTESDAQAARVQNNLVMNQLSISLQNMGLSKDNIKTTGFYMSPNYDSKGRDIVSYTVSNNLQVKVTDLDMISQIISKAGTVGANKVNGIRFTNERSEQIKQNLIKEAIINGKRTAETAAAAAGGQLGKVKEINVSGASPAYERAYSGMTMLRAAKADTNTPIEAGTNTLSETVSMTFYLQ